MRRDKDWEVIHIEEEHHVGMARQAVRKYAQLMGFGEVEMTFIITSVSELARNILVYAGRGTAAFRQVSKEKKKGLEIIFADKGPGIEDIERVLRGGYSTGGSSGIGLSGAKRMMDELEIKSEPEKGTTIRIRKWL